MSNASILDKAFAGFKDEYATPSVDRRPRLYEQPKGRYILKVVELSLRETMEGNAYFNCELEAIQAPEGAKKDLSFMSFRNNKYPQYFLRDCTALTAALVADPDVEIIPATVQDMFAEPGEARGHYIAATVGVQYDKEGEVRLDNEGNPRKKVTVSAITKADQEVIDSLEG